MGLFDFSRTTIYLSLRDSSFCYWHHKARARRRRYERIGYLLQLASSNIRNLTPLPADGRQVSVMGADDDQVFNDCVGNDDRDEVCDGDCAMCADDECETRTDEDSDSEDEDAEEPIATSTVLPNRKPDAIPGIEPDAIPKIKPRSVKEPAPLPATTCS